MPKALALISMLLPGWYVGETPTRIEHAFDKFCLQLDGDVSRAAEVLGAVRTRSITCADNELTEKYGALRACRAFILEDGVERSAIVLVELGPTGERPPLANQCLLIVETTPARARSIEFAGLRAFGITLGDPNKTRLQDRSGDWKLKYWDLSAAGRGPVGVQTTREQAQSDLADEKVTLSISWAVNQLAPESKWSVAFTVEERPD